MKGTRIERLDQRAVAARQAELARFERAFTYPLGADRFRIDHGDDYLAFFRGLGEPSVFAATLDGALAGLLVAVLRQMPDPVWYLCDLKVTPAKGGLGLGRALLRAFAAAHLDDANRAFGISMNPAAGKNRLARLALQCPAAGVRLGPTLAVVSFDFAVWQRIEALLARSLGPLHFYDPRGRKDIVLRSTGAPMPLLHLQHGPFARRDATAARSGCTHMLCLPQRDPLVAELAAAGLAAGASATVLHAGLDDFDWRHVLTSDI